MTPSPEILVKTAALCCDRLADLEDADWQVHPEGIDWTARQILEHVASLTYAPALALGTDGPCSQVWVSRADATVGDLIGATRAMAAVLAMVARGVPVGTRAFHPAGRADASGFVAMAMDELLVHTDDILGALGGRFGPPEPVVVAVLDRLFPWWPREAAPWDALLWANGRTSLPGRDDLGASWLWHCAPLDEWDGRLPVWDPTTDAPASDGST